MLWLVGWLESDEKNFDVVPTKDSFLGSADTDDAGTKFFCFVGAYAGDALKLGDGLGAGEYDAAEGG